MWWMETAVSLVGIVDSVGLVAKNYSENFENGSTVFKCCPLAKSLNGSLECVEGEHFWQGVEVRWPGCKDPVLSVARTPFPSCYDTLDGELVSLNCPSKNELSTTPLFLRKCCPPSQNYWPHRQQCGSPSLSRFLAAMTSPVDFLSMPAVMTIGPPECGQEEALVDRVFQQEFLQFTGSQVILKGLELETSFSCIDTAGPVIVLRTCLPVAVCSTRYCVRKCCPPGEYYQESSCSPGQTLSRMEFHTVSGRPLPSESNSLVIGDPCPGAKYVASPVHADPDGQNNGDFVLLSNASIMFISTGEIIGPKQHCFEHVNYPALGFAGDYLMLCAREEDQADGFSYVRPKFLMQGAGLIASVLFLMAALTTYCCVHSLRNLHGKTLMCHFASLLAAFSCLAAVQIGSEFYSDPVCLFLGFCLQFTFLASFAWLNVIGFDIWWTFGTLRSRMGRESSERRRYLMYSAYAWGQPCLITGLAVAADYTDILPHRLRPKIGDESCFFSRWSEGALIFFIGPEAVMVVTNIVFFWLTARYCSKVKNELARMRHSAKVEKKLRADKSKLVMTVKLSVVMGVNWTMELVSWFFYEPAWIWYFPDLYNALQGLLIFLIFILKRDVLESLRRRLTACKKKSSTSAAGDSISLVTIVTSIDNRVNRLLKSSSRLNINEVETADERRRRNRELPT